MSTSGTATYNDYALEIVNDAWFDAGVEEPTVKQVSYAMRLLNRMLKGLQTRGDFLHTREAVVLNLTAADKDYTLDADCTEIMDVYFRRDGSDIELTRYSSEEYERLPYKTTAGDPYSYFIDMQRAAPVLYLFPVPSNTTSLVSNGGNDYRCIKNNTSAAADEPGVGANTATYWELIGATGAYTAWAADTAYKSDKVVFKQLRKIEDVTYHTNNLDIPVKQIDAIAANLAHRLAPSRDDLRMVANDLMRMAFADDNERGPMRMSVEVRE